MDHEWKRMILNWRKYRERDKVTIDGVFVEAEALNEWGIASGLLVLCHGCGKEEVVLLFSCVSLVVTEVALSCRDKVTIDGVFVEAEALNGCG
ncbi:hypothetical protein Bca52824_035263 [Brassica carinata]|uniref:Uncharacterized protein n=1 Tax=Brassica carinata TaxID=52824 RepID=A0A8X7V3X4_BRACI|nr:hypothetical protein Bca52824_035263 [Brassica carinata]